jgi:4-amino-4-deoxy-L-arabinose transferase-like glycosyltransferase
MAVSLLSTGPLFLFAILGTVAMWLHEERRRDLWFLWGTILSFAVTYSFFFTQSRYRIPIEPFIIILSAYGIKQTWDLAAARFARRAQVEVRPEAAVGNVRGSKFEVRG